MRPEDVGPRLKRQDWLFTRDPLYFVTANTENRRQQLSHDRVHQAFHAFCQGGLERGVFVGRYVLMPDHLHLFVTFGAEYKSRLIARRESDAAVAAVCDRRISPLWYWMKSLKNSLSKTLRFMGVPAPHWQKAFFDHVLRSEESYSEKWLYVAENPVRKGLVPRWEDWPFQGEIYPLQTRGHL